ncbi:MAG: hypothetical protein KBD16_01400 [Candidatus Pacebacteria bacterium]|nr:hypothetical protein [Candidatus Paceibacterota bacterium]
MDTNSNLPVPSQGPVVGIIVVIIVLIVGAFYFFTRLSNVDTVPPTDITGSTSDDVSFAPTSPSDEPDAIENDLNAEDFSDIDAELDSLDAEFSQ